MPGIVKEEESDIKDFRSMKREAKNVQKDEGPTIIDWAAEVGALTGAIRLPTDTGTFGCSVSRLTRFIPP